VARAASLTAAQAWFSRIGAALSDADRDAAQRYLAALELADLQIVAAADAATAQRIIRDPHWDTRWWSREEAERKRLTERVASKHGVRGALAALTSANEGQTEQTLRCAMASAAIAAGGEALARAAAGALSMALHAVALARLAGSEESHLFVRKYALFSLGRWPLGVSAGALHLF
jgi:hypothetical protein